MAIDKGFIKVKVNLNGSVIEVIMPDTKKAFDHWKELIVE